MTIWTALAVLAALVILISLAAYAARRNETARMLEKQTDDFLEAANIRDRLRHDDDFADRVRKRFTR
ncbi:MAG: hypothetical protein RBS08_07855 [Bdellovibrionales bacterium]|jgi:hypothetical protein|nr:hypothetical protein [Bdellovibrionales bacterium]